MAGKLYNALVMDKQFQVHKNYWVYQHKYSIMIPHSSSLKRSVLPCSVFYLIWQEWKRGCEGLTTLSSMGCTTSWRWLFSRWKIGGKTHFHTIIRQKLQKKQIFMEIICDLGSLNNVIQCMVIEEIASLSLIYSITLLSKIKYGATLNKPMLHLFFFFFTLFRLYC